MTAPEGVSGLGIDLTDVGRVRAAIACHGARFVHRICTESEAEYCLSRPDPAPHVAARFAAKEAVIKCLGGGCSLREIEVVRLGSGRPVIRLHGRALVRAAGRSVLVSLTHGHQMAGAVAAFGAAPEIAGEED